mgnify:CR=1 FL=1
MNELKQIIADYRRAQLAGLPVDTVELFRQLDDALADVGTFVASEYKRARLASLPIDIGKLVMQLEIAIELADAQKACELDDEDEFDDDDDEEACNCPACMKENGLCDEDDFDDEAEDYEDD